MKTLPPQNRPKPLSESEILDAELRCLYDFGSQSLEWDEKRQKSVLWISRRCPLCDTTARTRVATVRAAVRQANLTGHCRRCAAAERSRRRPQPRGKKSPKWKGGRHIDDRGYVRIHLPDHPNSNNGYILEHRVVMEKHLGRLLVRGETVHHKNGAKADNRLCNLELWSRDHGNGQRYEDLSTAQINRLIDMLKDIVQRREA